MKWGRLLILVGVFALVGVFVDLVLFAPTPSTRVVSPARPVQAGEPQEAETPAVELADPDALERSGTTHATEAVTRPLATGAREEAASIDRSLAATVEWLRASLPERFGELTVAQALALEELDLRGVTLKDADLLRLSAFPNLKTLGLRGTAITDQGLDALRGLPLESLDLRGTGVTGGCLSSLPSATLTALHLTDTRIAGAELARLPPMPRLATLKLNQLELTDEAVEALSIYPRLKHLELDSTGLTDAGLRRLFALHPELARLEARGTALTAEAVFAVRRAHPGCEIVLQ